jgi:HEAT repeat protein
MAGLTAPLALATVAAAVALGLLAARAARRMARRNAREAAQEFHLGLDAYLAREAPAGDLMRCAADLAPDQFWSEIDAAVSPLPPRSRLALEHVLERSRHVTAERRALRDDSPWRRELAARRLRALGAVRHRRLLRRTMAAGPELVTLAAAFALGRARDRRSLDWILAHPASIERRSIQAHIGLLQSFGRGAAPLLLDALRRGPGTRRMHRAVIETLASCGYAPAAVAIVEELNDSWRDVRVAAARALGALGDARYAGALIGAMGDREWHVRAQAARALGRLGATAAVEPLAEVLGDHAWWVRRHAAYALLALGEPGRQALEQAARSHADRYAREMADEALSGGMPGALGRRRAAP